MWTKKAIYSGSLLLCTCILCYQRALIAPIEHFSRRRGLQRKKQPITRTKCNLKGNILRLRVHQFIPKWEAFTPRATIIIIFLAIVIQIEEESSCSLLVLLCSIMVIKGLHKSLATIVCCVEYGAHIYLYIHTYIHTHKRLSGIEESSS